MVELTRREAVRATGIAAVAALAGCTDETGERMATGSPDADADAPEETATDDTDTMTDDTDDRPTDVATTVHQLGRGLDRSWDREQRPGICLLFGSAGDAEAFVEDADEETQSFVTETDFEASTLLYVESVGPTGCYDEVEFSELEVDGDAVLRGNAAAVDTSDQMTACQQVITYPGALVRVAADVRRTELRVFDGWGQSGLVRSDGDGAAGMLRREGEWERR